MRLVPARKERLGDQLYGQILEQIVSGTYKEGDKLPSESQICQAFQVSRPTVREALMRLHADGLVATRQGSGTFVQKRPSGHLTRLAPVSDIAGILRCMEVRMALEDRAAGLAAERRSTADLDRILKALDSLRSSLEAGAVPVQADYDFHRAVAAASGNALFVEMLEALNETIHQSMTVALGITNTRSRERARRVIEEHEAIAEAIRRGDAEGASLSMRYHLHRARQRVTDGQRDL
ncbi:FadR family transcriptional regulator [Roseomonas sp. SSH11]|uniref:FadR family transcriptional regulator n=1 Tax=Pararoseomonas baculiformis TaxID=2820812 RepID=A0ABS4ACT6_9PROT|nr:FadR/GntR family transcriptional regulator [Pararoseomonas baculiformis]MBP0444810.1 FadR family transcriptional regulator [Pararoseomonas baculiformis]